MKELRAGDVVMIKNQKLDGTVIDEGEAKLLQRCDSQPIDAPQWNVEFLSEKGTTYRRYIY